MLTWHKPEDHPENEDEDLLIETAQGVYVQGRSFTWYYEIYHYGTTAVTTLWDDDVRRWCYIRELDMEGQWSEQSQ